MSRLPALLLAPVALQQGRQLQRDTPRLPEAHGPRDGLVGGGSDGRSKPLRLLVVGDSTAMGTGTAVLDDAIPGRLGRLLAAADGGTRGVAWRAVGRNGATAREVLIEFGDTAVAAHFDVAVVLVGWNDALRLRSGAEFSRSLGALLDLLRDPEHGGSPDARLLVVAPPEFGRFPSLPNPLRFALGRHALGLTRRSEQVARAHHALTAPGFDGAALASDGFHPDGDGYQRMAEGIADALASAGTAVPAGPGSPSTE